MNPLNGWQNEGIMSQYAVKYIDFTYRASFQSFVHYSFGYGKTQTLYWTIDKWAEVMKIGRATMLRHIKYLSDNGHIKVIHQHGYVEGGGKLPYAYAPVFPKVGNIWIDKGDKKDKTKYEITTWE